MNINKVERRKMSNSAFVGLTSSQVVRNEWDGTILVTSVEGTFLVTSVEGTILVTSVEGKFLVTSVEGTILVTSVQGTLFSCDISWRHISCDTSLRICRIVGTSRKAGSSYGGITRALSCGEREWIRLLTMRRVLKGTEGHWRALQALHNRKMRRASSEAFTERLGGDGRKRNNRQWSVCGGAERRRKEVKQ